MAIWVCRTGLNGQFEELFLSSNIVCLTREGYNLNLLDSGKDDVLNIIEGLNPGAAKQTISNTWSQIDIFANRMQVGDIVIIPKKRSYLVSVGIVTGNYEYDESKPFPLNHSRTISILKTGIDTQKFPKDIFYSLGAFRTIFEIKQEKRLKEILSQKGVVFDEIQI